MPVARRDTCGGCSFLTAWRLPLPAGRFDRRACPPALAVVRLEAGAPGCRAGGRRSRNQPLPLSLPEHPPHQSFPPATGSETRFATSTRSGGPAPVASSAPRTRRHRLSPTPAGLRPSTPAAEAPRLRGVVDHSSPLRFRFISGLPHSARANRDRRGPVRSASAVRFRRRS